MASRKKKAAKKVSSNQRRIAPVEVVGVRRDDSYDAEYGDYLIELRTSDPLVRSIMAGLAGLEIAIDIDATLAARPAPDVINIVSTEKTDEG